MALLYLKAAGKKERFLAKKLSLFAELWYTVNSKNAFCRQIRGVFMNERLLRELSHITEEEQDILDGKTGIDRTLYSEGSDFVITSEKMLKEGRLIQFRPHTRFVYFPRHTHNYVEMIYMCSGSTTHIINGTELILQRGELLI